ncbi:YqzE family protein [Paenibacillus crassostreae]|uniref:YqzE family protein n=1 Tax=Paenibacillus crassostreae TaxID=1763538 RepID=A0A167FVV4_9BACL|nr:YqzE family protein [Paenibacillus crassostreae]AOZ94009.1 hypothetical protein LPB68_18680 [Paenibacillus crassostreae]OAB76955.1 hypothetical protein PNBC_06055 [Paenibacillus crassostreae]
MGDELKLVKYITEQVVTYMETPKDERRTSVREPWATKWFGMIPLSLTLWRRNRLTSPVEPTQESVEFTEIIE